ncbi:TPA: hypothetical protein H1595_002339 [Listeria monocytogenes]|nr:hypothetical protein [Listeria monocytogenes]HAK1345203.1 hypothetical protein [Listeria monocytogenes]
MREIEFRGKRIDNGEWVYGNLMQFEDSATFIFADERKGASTLTYAHFIINNMHAIDEKTIGQYTGLKDKNGNKIFEGDVVKWGDTLGGEERPIRIATVKINPDIQFDSNVGIFNYGQFAYKNTEKFLTILGNIHDNPEYLEVSE